MLHPSHMDIVHERFKKMDYEPKKIKKYYKEKINTYGRKCRIKIGELGKEFFKGTEIIYDLLNQTMRIPYAFSSGNIFIVGCFIDDFIIYMKEMEQRILQIKNNDLLQAAHEQIMEKQKEIINVLIENTKKPINIDELNNILIGKIGDR